MSKKRVLITGANSYIGTSFENYTKEHYRDNFIIDTVDMKDGSWKDYDFSKYDTIFHVAGIAHADVGNVSEETKQLYYKVNTDLAIDTAKKAKEQGVKQFVYMSSLIVYGESAPYGKQRIIAKDTQPEPANFYGDSKWQADKGIRELETDKFKVLVLRPPMIYGKGSKGNYPVLAKLAKKLPIFPNVTNERSMLYIENLCEFLCQVIIKEKSGIFHPQNAEYTRTVSMVEEIRKVQGKKLIKLGLLNPFIKLGTFIPGKISGLINKAFGNMIIDQSLSEYDDIDYRKVGLKESIERTEGKDTKKKKHILVVSQYFYPEQFRINDICIDLVKRGYKVTVLTGIPNYPQGDFYEGYGYKQNRRENWNGIDIIRLPIKPRKKGKINLALNYLSFVTKGYLWNLKNDINADEVFIYEVSPMTQALVGVKYAKKHKVKCMMYVTDLWPENVEIVLGIHNKLFLNSIGIMVDYIYKNCDKILTSSRSFIDKIESRNVSKDKIEFWPQYAEDFYKKEQRIEMLEIPNDNIKNFTFAGNIGTAQGLDVLVEAAKLLKKDNIKVRFNIIGNGRYEEELKEKIKSELVEEYFNFIPRKPAEMIPKYFAWSDAALITLSKSEVYAMTIPAKTQSCLACGIPIMVSADGEVQNVIKEANCGFYSDSGDYVELYKNIKKFISLPQNDIERMSLNAINYYNENFNKEKLMDKLEVHI